MNNSGRVNDYLNSAPMVSIIIIILFIQTLIHLRYLDLPPSGFHQWRQTQTLSVARNFFEEDMNIFYPRVDSRGEFTGITGMEFPLVSYLIAVGYKIFGYSYIIQRVIMLLFSFIALWGCFLFFRKLLNSQSFGAFASFFLMFSPLFCYYSICALPEVPALSFSFLSLYFFLSFSESGKKSCFIAGLIALTLAALIKLSSLVIVLYIVYCIVKRNEKRFLKVVRLAGIGFVFIVVAAWYVYARYLRETYNNFDFRLEMNFPYSVDVILNVMKKVFVQWLPELYINYAAFVFFCAGVYFLIKVKYRVMNRFIFLYLTSFLIYFILFLPMFEIHDYYAVPVLPVLTAVTTAGFVMMFEKSQKKKWVLYFTCLLLVTTPILGTVRSLSRLESIDRKAEIFSVEEYLNAAAPEKDYLVIAAGDFSPSIYLYFMHRKGWSVGEKLSPDDIDVMRSKGARYLISTSRTVDTQPALQDRISYVSEYGNFRLYELKQIVEH